MNSINGLEFLPLEARIEIEELHDELLKRFDEGYADMIIKRYAVCCQKHAS